jgi:hypothetical protein
MSKTEAQKAAFKAAVINEVYTSSNRDGNLVDFQEYDDQIKTRIPSSEGEWFTYTLPLADVLAKEPAQLAREGVEAYRNDQGRGS